MWLVRLRNCILSLNLNGHKWLNLNGRFKSKSPLMMLLGTTGVKLWSQTALNLTLLQMWLSCWELCQSERDLQVPFGVHRWKREPLKSWILHLGMRKIQPNCKASWGLLQFAPLVRQPGDAPLLFLVLVDGGPTRSMKKTLDIFSEI